MERSTGLRLNPEEDDELFLAFPPVKDAMVYKTGVRTAQEGQEKPFPAGMENCMLTGIPVQLSFGSQIVPRCGLAGAYNYPFNKVRIFNRNLEDAHGDIKYELES